MSRLQSSPTEGLLVDDAMKFHVNFKILFVHFSLNYNHQTCFPSNNTRSSVCCHPFSFWPWQLKFLHAFSHMQKPIYLCSVMQTFKTSQIFDHLGTICYASNVHNNCCYSHPSLNKAFKLFAFVSMLTKQVTNNISSSLHHSSMRRCFSIKNGVFLRTNILHYVLQTFSYELFLFLRQSLRSRDSSVV